MERLLVQFHSSHYQHVQQVSNSLCIDIDHRIDFVRGGRIDGVMIGIRGSIMDGIISGTIDSIMDGVIDAT